MEILYRTDLIPATGAIIALYEDSGLSRPTNDEERISKMYAHSNLVVSAWHDELLVGISRSLTDHCWSCYLADLSVRTDYKKKGIGKRLIELTKEAVGEQSMVLLLSVSTAMEYYPKAGMQKVENGFIIQRTK